MNYYLKYYSEYYDRKNNNIRIEIYTTTSGQSEEVLLSSDAITVEYSQDSIFESLKPSRASINLLVTDVKTDIFSGALCGVMVKIFKNNSLFWFGYATPNVYSQPYQKHYDQLTIECVDSVALLGDVAYSYIDNLSSTSVFSFFDVIASCIHKVDPNHTINKMYVDNSITYNGSGKILNNLYLQERNFFDEKEVAENCDEVVGSILKYLGLTLIQYKDAYYIVNQSKVHTNTYNVIQYSYSNGWNAGTATSLTLTPMTPSQIGIGENKGEIGMDGVYNKVTVIANNNPLSNILPDFNDGDDLVNYNGADSAPYEENYSIDGNNYTLLSGFFKSRSNWQFALPSIANGYSDQTVDTIDLTNRDNLVSGTFWQMCDYYNAGEAHPSVKWSTYLTFVGKQYHVVVTPYLALQNTKKMIIDGGYLVVNLTYRFSNQNAAHTVVKSKYDSFGTFGYCSDLCWTDGNTIGSGNWPMSTLFRAKLKVGDWLYNGEWVSYTLLQQKRAHWNQLYAGEQLDLGGHTLTWYGIRDSQFPDEWEYTNESTYNAFSGEKQSGQCRYAHAHKTYNRNIGEYIAIPDEFFMKLMYGEYFFLAHENQTSETIYDADYSLTNTVDWKMNIAGVNSNGGVAIKCPENITFFGRVEFELFPPIESINQLSMLGLNPQYRTDKPNTTLTAIHISELSISYNKQSVQSDVFNLKSVNPDTIFTNKINDDFCKELDDITLKVNTANDYATSYSYVIAKNGNDYLYIKTLNFGNGNETPEERIVERMVDHYKTPKFQYGNTLKNRDTITPFFPLLPTLNNQQKQMVVKDATYDMMNDTVAVKAQEI